MQRHILIILAALALSAVAFSQTIIDSAHPDAFQVRYVSNVVTGTINNDPNGLSLVINLTNTGSSATTTTPRINGNICVNVYAFDAAEEMLSCCGCVVTPNGLQHLSVQNDIASNLLTSGAPPEYVIKLVATTLPTSTTVCDPGSVSTDGTTLASGMRAWGTTFHVAPGSTTTPPTFVLTEGAFLNGGLSSAELTHLTQFCGFIEGNATPTSTNPNGFGICNSCKLGALGGAKAN